MSRELTEHRNAAGAGLDQSINIHVLDEPGQGGACHHYRIEPIADDHPQGAINPADIHFQNGPVKENGVNGVSQESLLAVVIDRLRSFQAGQYSCRENAIALTKLQEALMWMHKRTTDRVARGVEGTNVK